MFSGRILSAFMQLRTFHNVLQGCSAKKGCGNAVPFPRVPNPLHPWFRLKLNSNTKYCSGALTRKKLLQFSKSATRRKWNKQSKSSSNDFTSFLWSKHWSKSCTKIRQNISEIFKKSATHQTKLLPGNQIKKQPNLRKNGTSGNTVQNSDQGCQIY